MPGLLTKYRINKQLVLNILALIVLSGLMLANLDPIESNNWQQFIIYYSILIILSSPAYLITSLFLVPVLLVNQKYKILTICITLTVLCTAFICLVGLYYLDNTDFTLFEVTFKLPILFTGYNLDDANYLFYLLLWNSLLGVLTSGTIAVFDNNFKINNQFIDIENEKLASQLKYLKSQINPDFLIETLTALKDSLKNDQSEATDMIDTLKNIMHYQIYECAQNEIEIEKELQYLNSYIKVQKQRIDKNSDIRVEITENLKDLYIAPLIIQPLVENAFKHLSHHEDASKNKVYISIKSEDPNEICISIHNTYSLISHLPIDKKQKQGIGLKNLKKRLKLIYPDQHSFKISTSENLFIVELNLKL